MRSRSLIIAISLHELWICMQYLTLSSVSIPPNIQVVIHSIYSRILSSLLFSLLNVAIL